MSESDDYKSDLSDTDISDEEDGYSSVAEKQAGLRARRNIPWDPIDEQRLVAWKKEGKSWEWIFNKFSSRTPATVRNRWSKVRSRSE